ncbi:MAG: DNA-formamidopyrimidine glycosylase [Bacillota bacterium]
MPELPEVETVRRSLYPLIKDRTIEDVIVYYPTMIKDMDADAFKTKVIGKTFNDIGRLGKHLMFKVGELTMIIHLRMEGKFLIKQKDTPKDTHEHLRFILSDGRALSYYDVRKFGTLHLREDKDLFITKPLMHVAAEPISDAFDITEFKRKLDSNRPIKAAILDQTVISGIGNIYADEILFCARIHPETIARTLTPYRVKKLAHCAKDILNRAVESGGTTIRTYKNALGIDGMFQLHLNVHMREGEACKNCGRTIKKEKVAGRGTYFCPTCQKKG